MHVVYEVTHTVYGVMHSVYGVTHVVYVSERFDSSDHNIIKFNVKCASGCKIWKEVYYDCRNANYPDMLNFFIRSELV